jgi:hypothetical protein
MCPSVAHHQLQVQRARKYGNARTRALNFPLLADFLRTVGGGMPGSAARGFGNATMFRLKALPTVTQPIRRCLSGNTGWQQFMAPAAGGNPAYLSCSYGTGSTQVSGAPAWLTAADVGRVHIYLTRITPTPGLIETYFDSMQLGNVALSAYAPPPGGTQATVGNDGTSAASAFEWIADLDFYDVPTAAQILAFFRAARGLGDLPDALGTTEVRHSLKTTLGGTAVVDGQAAPTSFADSNAGSSAYALAAQGAPVVRDYWNTNGARSFGIRNAATGNFYKTANPGGVGGTTSPFVVSAQVTFEEPVVGATQYLVSRTDNATLGWGLYVVDGTTIGLSMRDGGTWRGLTYAVPATVIGQSRTVSCTYTGTSMQLWFDDVMTGELAFTGTFAPYSGVMAVGALQDGSAPVTTVSIQAVSCKDAATSASELTKHVARTRALGRLARLPGASTKHYDFTADIEAAGGPGAGPPATSVERGGSSDSLSRTGAGILLVSRKTERTNGFEAAATCNGFMPNATGTFYESTATGHDGGASSGKSVAVLMRIDSQLISKPREIFSIGTASAQTMYIRATGAMNILSAGWLTTTPSWSTSPNVIVSAGDVGRLMLLVAQWDQPAGRNRVYWRGVEQNAVMASWAATYGGAGNTVRLGQLQTAASFPAYFAEEVTIFGALTYDGVWTQNQIRFLYDSVAAEDDLIGVPGYTGHLWSLKQAIGTGVSLPASVPDAQGISAMNMAGSPTFKSSYAHAPKWAA